MVIFAKEGNYYKKFLGEIEHFKTDFKINRRSFYWVCVRISVKTTTSNTKDYRQSIHFNGFWVILVDRST